MLNLNSTRSKWLTALAAFIFFAFFFLNRSSSSEKCNCNAQQQPQQVQQQSQEALLLSVIRTQLDLLTQSISTQNSAPVDVKAPIYLGNNNIMCHARHLNRWMFFDSRDKGIMPHICTGFPWEIEITRAFESTVRPGWTVLDIGANYGWYTLKLADLVGGSGKVISLEAQPRTFGLLSWAVEINGLNGHVSVYNNAVYSRSNETVKISFIPDRPLNNALLVDTMKEDNRSVELMDVKTIKIDDLVTQLNLTNVDFMKIDVEGVEDAVWDGMQETLTRFPKLVVFMEVNSYRMRENNKDPRAFYNKIQSRFPVLRRVGDYGAIVPIDIENMVGQTSDIFLALYDATAY
ncbi:hypothetical protein HK098_008340 [Nowakowskiella sp. JEL0407]|nr:hypothetical protein HK098_008340 [Nowakowskiella sp. JEL0407]